MIGYVAGFLGLSLFATFVVSVVILGRKAMQVFATRAGIEVAKAKATKSQLEHDLRVAEHQRGLQILALTAAPEKELEEPPEAVKVSEVITPIRTHQEFVQDRNHEYMKTYAEEAKIVDA